MRVLTQNPVYLLVEVRFASQGHWLVVYLVAYYIALRTNLHKQIHDLLPPFSLNGIVRKILIVIYEMSARRHFSRMSALLY
jgi:hypothetical protein